MSFHANHSTAIPQTQPVPGFSTIPNSSGGYSFAADHWQQLDRFIILGTEGSSYYATQRDLTQQNLSAIETCARIDGAEAVRRIIAVSTSGRAAKNEYAILALAVVAARGNPAGRAAAYQAVPEVCRTGTHLFQFAAASRSLRGWGRGLREAIAQWYHQKPLRQLAYQVAKYQQRDGWSHRDLLRLSHPRPDDSQRNQLFGWVVGKHKAGEHTPQDDLAPLYAIEAARRASDPKEIVSLIREYRLVRECIPTPFLRSPHVWEALLDDMPLMAMVRNLGTMTRNRILRPGTIALKSVLSALSDVDRLRKARIHPLQWLVALKTYAAGSGLRGKSTWSPLPTIVEALDQAFYASFQTVESTGRRWMLALDISGSMSCGAVCGNPSITPRIAAAAMALVTATVEPRNHMVAFSTNLAPLPIQPGMRLDQVLEITDRLPFGGTNCALPMLYAQKHRIPVDVFVIYTDSETWLGDIHPFQALRQYRSSTGIPAKLIVVGMVSNGFTIADPNDAGMLDVVGFDTVVPSLIAEFAKQ